MAPAPAVVVLERVLEYQFQPEHVAIFITLIYLEAVLSFDNAAILAAMVRPLPVEQRRKALLYGLIGAYTFRTLAILLVAVIIDNPFLKVLGGLYLLYLPIRHFWPSARDETGEVIRKPMMIPGLTAFWSTVVFVELADIAFALDQILVAVALTEEIAIILVAAMIAILFLRIAAGYLTRVMDWFPTLESLAYLAVGFVGLKLLAEEAFDIHVPRWIAVGVTFTILVLPVLVKVVAERFASRRQAS